MVRAVANRAFLPIRSVLERVGDMMVLTGKTIWSALRPPYPYGGEFVNQFLGGFLVFTQTLLATHPEISIIK